VCWSLCKVEFPETRLAIASSFELATCLSLLHLRLKINQSLLLLRSHHPINLRGRDRGFALHHSPCLFVSPLPPPARIMNHWAALRHERFALVHLAESFCVYANKRRDDVAPPEERSLSRLRASIEPMNSVHFEVLVVGERGNGKSTFASALLGLSVFPSSTHPGQTVFTKLVHGETPTLTVVKQTGPPEVIDISQAYARLQAGDPGGWNEQVRPKVIKRDEQGRILQEAFQVSEVLIALPDETLRGGLCLVDTPGINETEALTSRVVERCKTATAVLFVCSATRGMISEQEQRVLRDMKAAGVREVFVVFNHLDRHRENCLDNGDNPIATEQNLRLRTEEMLRSIFSMATVTPNIFFVASRPLLRVAGENSLRGSGEENEFVRGFRETKETLMREFSQRGPLATINRFTQGLHELLDHYSQQCTLQLGADRVGEDALSELRSVVEEYGELVSDAESWCTNNRDVLVRLLAKYILRALRNLLRFDSWEGQTDIQIKARLVELLQSLVHKDQTNFSYDEADSFKSELSDAISRQLSRSVADVIHSPEFAEDLHHEMEALHSRVARLEECVRHVYQFARVIVLERNAPLAFHQFVRVVASHRQGLFEDLPSWAIPFIVFTLPLSLLLSIPVVVYQVFTAFHRKVKSYQASEILDEFADDLFTSLRLGPEARTWWEHPTIEDKHACSELLRQSFDALSSAIRTSIISEWKAQQTRHTDNLRLLESPDPEKQQRVQQVFQLCNEIHEDASRVVFSMLCKMRGLEQFGLYGNPSHSIQLAALIAASSEELPDFQESQDGRLQALISRTAQRFHSRSSVEPGSSAPVKPGSSVLVDPSSLVSLLYLHCLAQELGKTLYLVGFTSVTVVSPSVDLAERVVSSHSLSHFAEIDLSPASIVLVFDGVQHFDALVPTHVRDRLRRGLFQKLQAVKLLILRAMETDAPPVTPEELDREYNGLRRLLWPFSLKNADVQFEKPLGGASASAFGALSKAEVFHRSVAIKRLRESSLIDRYMFYVEAAIISMLQSPWIARSLGLLLEDDSEAIVLELGHCDLQRRLGELRNSCSENDWLPCFVQMCSALFTMHQSGVVHADIKPANILCSVNQDSLRDVTIKMVDFGVSGYSPEPAADLVRRTFVGTRLFMPEELLRPTSGEYLAAAADIFSLGATMLWCLDQQMRPRVVHSMMDRQQLYDWVQGSDSISTELKAVLLPTMHTDPVQRPSAATLREQIWNLFWQRRQSSR